MNLAWATASTGLRRRRPLTRKGGPVRRAARTAAVAASVRWMGLSALWFRWSLDLRWRHAALHSIFTDTKTHTPSHIQTCMQPIPNTHTCARALKHKAHTHTHTQPSHTCVHTQTTTPTFPHAHARTRTHAHTDEHSITHIRTHMLTRTHTHIHTYTHIHTHTHTHTHTCTRTRTRARTRARQRTRARTQCHTHTHRCTHKRYLCIHVSIELSIHPSSYDHIDLSIYSSIYSSPCLSIDLLFHLSTSPGLQQCAAAWQHGVHCRRAALQWNAAQGATAPHDRAGVLVSVPPDGRVLPSTP
jgi:hypothetical protein